MSISDFFKGKRVLVTGHTGFKGGWLSQILLQMRATVVGYSLAPDTNPNLFSILSFDDKVTSYISDVRDQKHVLEVIKKEQPEIIFHLAAQPLVRRSYDDPVYTFETNVIGTVNVLEAIRKTDCVRAGIFITTDKVYENKESSRPYQETDELGGHDPYSASKACAEFAIRSYARSYFPLTRYSEHKTLITSARAGNVIGGGDWSQDRLIPDIVRSVFETKKQVILRNPDAIRPWQHVLDPLYGYLLLAKSQYEGKSEVSGGWNFAPDEINCIRVEDLVKKAIQITGKGTYFIKKDNQKHEMQLLKLDATKAKSKLNWKPHLGISASLDWTFEWYKQHYVGADMVSVTNDQIRKYLALVES